jgi:monoamine oxidase
MKNGGIDHIAKAIANKIKNTSLNEKVIKIDA